MTGVFHLRQKQKFTKYWTEVVDTTGEAHGNPLQYACLENPMDGGVW